MSGYNEKDENKKIDSGSESEHDESPRPDPTASGSNDPIFTVSGDADDTTLMDLQMKFNDLSLEDQLKVAKKMEQEFKNAKERMKKVASSKAVEAEIKKANPKAKPVDRSKRMMINLNVRVRGTNRLDGTTITVNRHGKCGQIRHEICRLVGMKTNAKPTMECNDKRIEQMNVFIYTMGINNGDTIYLLPNVPAEVIAEMENDMNNAANAEDDSPEARERCDDDDDEEEEEQDEDEDEGDDDKDGDDADETAEQ